MQIERKGAQVKHPIIKLSHYVFKINSNKGVELQHFLSFLFPLSILIYLLLNRQQIESTIHSGSGVVYIFIVGILCFERKVHWLIQCNQEFFFCIYNISNILRCLYFKWINVQQTLQSHWICVENMDTAYNQSMFKY